MALAKLTNKGQVTIPKAVRDALGLHKGDKIEFIVNKNGDAFVRPAAKRVDDIFGKLYKKERTPVSIQNMDDVVKQKMKAKFK